MAELNYFIAPYAMPTGRLIHALKQVREKALDSGEKRIVKGCDVAIEHARSTQKVEREYQKGGASPTALTKKIDPILDRRFTVFRDVASAHLASLDPDEPNYTRLSNMLHHLFPLGVHAITSKPYVEELAAAEDFIAEAKQFDDVIDGFALRKPFQKIVEATAQYRASMNRDEKTYPVEFQTVREYREMGTNYLAQVIAMILGAYPSTSQNDRTMRTALLAPIVEQNEAMRQALRQKKPVADVDPDTGKEEPATEPPAVEAPPPPSPVVG